MHVRLPVRHDEEGILAEPRVDEIAELRLGPEVLLLQAVVRFIGHGPPRHPEAQGDLLDLADELPELPLRPEGAQLVDLPLLEMAEPRGETTDGENVRLPFNDERYEHDDDIRAR